METTTIFEGMAEAVKSRCAYVQDVKVMVLRETAIEERSAVANRPEAVIQLLDHVVIGTPSCDPTGRGYYSFRESGIL